MSRSCLSLGRNHRPRGLIAYLDTGPRDVVKNGVDGCLHSCLATAIAGAQLVDRRHCREAALSFQWQGTAQSLLDNLALRPNSEPEQGLVAVGQAGKALYSSAALDEPGCSRGSLVASIVETTSKAADQYRQALSPPNRYAEPEINVPNKRPPAFAI